MVRGFLGLPPFPKSFFLALARSPKRVYLTREAGNGGEEAAKEGAKQHLL